MRGGPWAKRLAQLLVRATLRPRDGERLLVDVAEEHRRYGRSHLWYWRQVLVSIVVLRRAHRPQAAPAAIEATVRDVRHALRQLARAPLFALPAIGVLALGVGATTAIFSLVDAVLLRPLPYAAPERIVRAWAHLDDGSLPDFSFRALELRAFEAMGVFEAVGGEFPVTFTALGADGEPVRVTGRLVSAGLFDVFGVTPALGRPIRAAEVAAGDSEVALVSDSFWRRHLGGDPGAVDATLDLDGAPYRVIGVLPAGYRHISGAAQVFVPYSLGTSGWIGRWLDIYGRLPAAGDSAIATERLTTTMKALAEGDGRAPEWHATLEDLHEMVVGDVRGALTSTLAVVGLVLLLACLNVANLCLLRSRTRAPEIAVRLALGASRGRVTRQLAVEHLVLGLAGGALGTGLAAAGVRLVTAAAPAGIPRASDATLDGRLLAFSAVLTLGTVLLFGVVPALSATRAAVPRGAPARRGRSALIVVEVGVAIVLLVGAGLLVRSLRVLRAEELGFERTGAVTFRVLPSSNRYAAGREVHDFHRVLLDRLAAIPDVVAVGAGSDLPISGEGAVATVSSRARLRAGVDEGLNVLQRRAAPGYFEALRTPILAGRAFDDTDTEDAPPVAIVSESLARLLFPAGEAVGELVGFGNAPGEDDWLTVVGVAADVRFESVEISPRPQIYQVHAQSATRELAYVLRGAATPEALIGAARAALRDLDPRVPLYDERPLGALVDDALATRAFVSALYGLFAAVALALTVAGIHGVVAYAVAERRGEMAVRVATGARPGDVVALVVRSGMRPVALGVLLGLPAGLFVSGLLRHLLYGVRPGDPRTLLMVVLLLGLVALAACWGPARRAARQDPMSVLRGE